MGVNILKKKKHSRDDLSDLINALYSKDSSGNQKDVKLFGKIVKNIIKNPKDEKKRKLNTDKISQKVSNPNDFFEALQFLGFQQNETYHILPLDADLTKLEQSLSYLPAKKKKPTEDPERLARLRQLEKVQAEN